MSGAGNIAQGGWGSHMVPGLRGRGALAAVVGDEDGQPKAGAQQRADRAHHLRAQQDGVHEPPAQPR